MPEPANLSARTRPRPKTDFQRPKWQKFEKLVEAKMEECRLKSARTQASAEAVDLEGLADSAPRLSPKWLPTMDPAKPFRFEELARRDQIEYHRQFAPCYEGTQKKIYDALLSIAEKDTEFIRSANEHMDAAKSLADDNPKRFLDDSITYESKFLEMEERASRLNTTLGLFRYFKGDQVPDRPLVDSEIYLSADEEHKKDYFCLVAEEVLLEGLEEYGITKEELFQCRPTFPKLEEATFLIPDHPTINSQTYSKHFEAGTCTLQEMKYGEDVFEHTFLPIFEAPTQQHGMNALGINKYDLIFINGQSVNELYGDRFKDLSDRQRSAMIQTAVVAAALDGKSHVECCRLQKNGDQYEISGAMTMKPKLELHEPQLSRWSRFKQALHLEPKVIPKAKQLEDLDKTDFKASARREKIAATAEERIHKKQEQKSSRAKTTLSELSDDRKKERRTEKTAEKTTPVKEKSSDRGMGR